MHLAGKKIAVLIESDFYEHEIFYYQLRFAEEGAEVQFMSRLWGNDSITFTGHEYKIPFRCDKSFEAISDDELAQYSALIVPSGIVADRLRYTDNIAEIPPASRFLERAFSQPKLLKGIICHGMWLVAPVPHLIRGRQAVVHNNLLGDLKAYGGRYLDQDVVDNGDLITARTGGHCHLFARRIIERLSGEG